MTLLSGFAALPALILADPRIPHAPKLCLMALATVTNDARRGDLAVAEVGQLYGEDERRTREHLAWLHRAGLIEVFAVFCAGHQRPNVYRLNWQLWEPARYVRHAIDGESYPADLIPDVYPEEWLSPVVSSPADSAGGENRSTDHDQDLDLGERGIGRRIPPPQTTSAKPTPDTGWLVLVDLYAAILPELTQPALRQGQYGKSLQQTARARWKENNDPAWWERYFRRVHAADWLMGRRRGNDGNVFKADLLWLLGPKNLEKVEAGRYDPPARRAAPAQASDNDPRLWSWDLTDSEWRTHGNLLQAWREQNPRGAENFRAVRGDVPFLGELLAWQRTQVRPHPNDRRPA